MLCKIALRYLYSYKKQNKYSIILNILILLGILIGSCALISVITVTSTLENYQKDTLIRQNPYIYISLANQQNASKLIANTIQGKLTTAADRFHALLENKNSIVPILVKTYPDYHLKNNEAVINLALAQQLSLYIGDNITVVLPNKPIYTLFGPVFPEESFKIAGYYDLDSTTNSLVINLPSANKLLYLTANQSTGYVAHIANRLAIKKYFPSQKYKFISVYTKNKLFFNTLHKEQIINVILYIYTKRCIHVYTQEIILLCL